MITWERADNEGLSLQAALGLTACAQPLARFMGRTMPSARLDGRRPAASGTADIAVVLASSAPAGSASGRSGVYGPA